MTLNLDKYPPGTPFRRAKATFDAIAAANGLPKTLRNVALAAIPPYRSRGKGKGKGFIATSGVPSSNKCNNAYDTPGYQGDRELARRVRQMEAVQR